jgi:hypothetical protein
VPDGRSFSDWPSISCEICESVRVFCSTFSPAAVSVSLRVERFTSRVPAHFSICSGSGSPLGGKYPAPGRRAQTSQLAYAVVNLSGNNAIHINSICSIYETKHVLFQEFWQMRISVQ